MCISFSIHSFVFFFPNVYVLYFSMLDANNTSFVCFLFILFVYLIRTNSLRLKSLMTIRVLTVDGREFHMYTKNPRADF